MSSHPYGQLHVTSYGHLDIPQSGISYPDKTHLGSHNSLEGHFYKYFFHIRLDFKCQNEKYEFMAIVPLCRFG